MEKIDNTKFTLIEIVEKNPPNGWIEVFKESYNELLDISNILDLEEKKYGIYYPYKCNIFNAFNLTPLNEVRVVIIGQDPYHDTLSNNKPRAIGVSFGIAKDDDTIPPSLRNIFLEIKRSIPNFIIPEHGDLTKWTKQGILLLNMCLTVNPGKPGSHGQIWMGLIYRVINAICERKRKTIFCLWGKNAQKLDNIINGRGIILSTSHPSPYSYNYGFKGCNHFNIINEHLVKMKDTPIDWNL